jgi:hypothetical protein|tara:strand:- start:16541 stop:18757 length:2217 start_codon:yes stop_codon:yes gene_type:complete
MATELYDDPYSDDDGSEEGATELVTSDPATTGTGGVLQDEREREPMTDREILSVVETELQNSGSEHSGELSENRILAMRYYEGRMRSAPKGRSQAVSTDVADVIEWTLPQCIEALVNTENVVLFDAQSEEDEEAAQLETDACEHVIFKENDGFTYFYSVVKDALMQKNGIGKIYWDESTSVCYETYEGLTEMEAAQLLQPEDGSIVVPTEMTPHEAGGAAVTMDGQPVFTYDITVRRVTRNGGVKVVPMPPEEFRVNRDHTSINLDDARFTAHERLATESDLISEGWPEDLVRDLPTYSVDTTGEREERRSLEDERDFGYDASDRATRRVKVAECYAHVDTDRDGYAELIQCHVAGDSTYVLMGWEHVPCNPFVGCTPFLMTHKFWGRSLYDKVSEIQDQKTELVRAIQDNLSHQNNARLAVVAGQVNLDDLLTTRPGGVVRQKAPGMIEPLVAPQIGELGYRQLEWLDNVRTGRAGVSPDTAAVANAIAGDTAHGLERLMSAKEELTGLIVKLFANTLSKGTLMKVRMNLQRYRKTPIHFQARKQWQEVNPAEWRARTGATVKTTLSHSDRMKKAQGLAMTLQQQQTVWEMGGDGILVTMDNIYNTLAEFTRSSHVGDPSPYWQDPKSPEAQQAMQQKQQEAMEQQQQVEAQQAQMQASQQMMLQAQAMIEQNRELTKRMESALKDAREREKMAQAALQHSQDLDLDYTKMEVDAAVDIHGQGLNQKPSPWDMGSAD